MRRLLGRIGEWSVTHPAAAIAGVLSVVAIVAVVGVLRLTPDAGTDKLVDNGSAAYAGTEEYRERFGDDAIVVLVQGDLKQLLLTPRVDRLLALESCLAGKPAAPGQFAADVCRRISELGATRVVFGPATFLSEAATRTGAAVGEQVMALRTQAQQAARKATREAESQGLSEAEQQQAASVAAQRVVSGAIDQLRRSNLSVSTLLGGFSIHNEQFVQAIVFDQAQDGAPPKSKFGYLFPSGDSALISIRLQPGISNDERRKAIGLIREAVGDDAFSAPGVSYELSGIPVVIEGLADELGGEIALLLAAAMIVMAFVLLVIFGPPLRLLPLFTALGSAGFALGLLSVLGGTLTMASVAVLPVVIGLGVDYAIQLQARFREALEQGRRPPASAVIAAVRGGPVIATAALATSVGFLALLLSPIPMVREFAVALVAGIAAALAISLTGGLAALSMARRAPADNGTGGRGGGERGLGGGPGLRATLARRFEIDRGRGALAGARARAAGAGRTMLAATIRAPGRVLLVAALLAAAGWGLGTGTKVVSDIRELVPADLPALRSVDALQDATGVSGELDVLVSGDVTSPAAIGWMSDFKRRILRRHGFEADDRSCLEADARLCPGPSLADLFELKPGDRPGRRRVEDVLDAVPPYFSQAILSRAGDGREGDVASLSFLIPVMPLDEQEALIDGLRGELDPPPGVQAEVVGLPVLAADANAQLSGSRYWLAIAGLLLVGVVLLAVYRRGRRALVPLLPIVLATGWSALVLELTGVALNPMSATLGALVIAIATEFSVILAARYHEERAAGLSVGEALRLTYRRTGAAVLASGITSIAGFGVLAFSGITMLRDFGLVTIVDLGVALAGVMLVLPAALVWAEGGFRPFPALRPARRRPGPDGAAASPADADAVL